MVGYRPYPALLEAVRYLAPELATGAPRSSPVDYVRHWGDATAPEAATATGRNEAEVAAELEAVIGSGALARKDLRRFVLYSQLP